MFLLASGDEIDQKPDDDDDDEQDADACGGLQKGCHVSKAAPYGDYFAHHVFGRDGLYVGAFIVDALGDEIAVFVDLNDLVRDGDHLAARAGRLIHDDIAHGVAVLRAGKDEVADVDLGLHTARNDGRRRIAEHRRHRVFEGKPLDEQIDVQNDQNAHEYRQENADRERCDMQNLLHRCFKLTNEPRLLQAARAANASPFREARRP